MPLLKPIRIMYELEDLSGGTRVTEYTAASPGFGQRFAFGMLMRMMAGRMTQAQESLRSVLAAAGSAPPPDDGGAET
jgi:hypothetical protein